ncbi:hypothetical protein B0H14DRAFT_2569187 [Mycena olivaceomarginata]|nr:hypothetical protein B0H14DRAFT_2569187 [Mycena olivaceomarginata]
MSRDTLLEQVLVPEAIVILISADLDVENDEAVQILLASTEFGLHYHLDPLDRQHAIITSPPSDHPQLPAPERTPMGSSSLLLPLPSLLGSPILSPALERPANWAFDLDPGLEPPPFDPALLCKYCDELPPAVQSKSLLALGKKLFMLSWDDPLPENAHHHRAIVLNATIFQMPFLPDGHCIQTLKSVFFLVAQQHYKGKTTKLQSIGAQYKATNHLAQQGVGYQPTNHPPSSSELLTSIRRLCHTPSTASHGTTIANP